MRAASGTLFLDEIGDLNEQSQIKLLRLLQEREFYAVGSDNPCSTNARVLLATNHDLQKLVAAGRFRKDLYFRLYAHRLLIPPLRERSEDIPLLLDHFLVTAAREFDKKKPTPPPELVNLLGNYPFPGNVRELEALVYNAVARHSAGVLSMENFRDVITDFSSDRIFDRSKPASDEALLALFGYFPTMAEVEEYMISEALKRAKGNQGIAANLLGIARQTLNKRLRRE
jgi:DNA-binding NtrC family response regulator